MSHETRLFFLNTSNPNMQAFLDLGEVSSALRAANMVVNPAIPSSEADYVSITKPTDGACPVGNVNTSPVAVQCCQNSAGVGGYGVSTLFIRGSDFAVISRVHAIDSSSNGDCRNQDGSSGCDGAACYFGPNGFTRPSVSAGDANTVIFTATTQYSATCSRRETPPKTFANVTGTFPTGRGCPGADPGYGDWDY